MKNSNVLVGLAVCYALFGCSGGSSNNNDAPSNTTTTYNINNKTLADFKTVSVVDNQTGAVTQTALLNCASQATGCAFYYTGPQFENGESLLFKDGNDQFVAAYVSSYRQLPYEEVIASPWFTGLYLYKELNKRNADIASMSQDLIEAKLDTFLQNYTSPDGADDYYEEIAAYYARKLANSQLSFSAFLDDFAQRLINGEVADASEFNQLVIGASPLRSIQVAFQDLWSGKQALVSPAIAQSAGGCPTGISGFLGVLNAVASGVQNAFPIAGTVASSVLSMADTACGAAEPSLADIMNKLNQIQGAIDALRDDLAKLTAFVADTNLNSVLSRFGKVATDSRTLGNQYNALLKTSSTQSLLGYVQKTGNGTLADVLNKYPSGALNDLLSSALGKELLLKDIRALTDEKFSTMLQSIRTKCDNITVGDLVSTRVQCNLVVSQSMSRLLASQKIALNIAKDAYAVADAFPAEVASRYGFAGNGTQAYAELKKQFDDQLLAAKNSYQATIINSDSNQKGYYNAYDNLPAGLFQKMKDVACWNYKLDVPAIGKWVKEDNGQTEYFETNCHVGSNQNPTVYARYFRKIDGASVGNDDVGNVMGVLVERRYITGSDYWYVGSRYTSSTPLYGVAVNMKVTSYPAYSNHFAINNASGRSSNKVFPDIASLNGPNLRMVKAQADNWESGVSEWLFNENGSGWSYNWMRYTDMKGYSYVFYLANSAGTGNYTGFYCVTGDCTVDGISLSFKHGPQKLKLLGGFGWSIDGQDLYRRK